MSQELVDNDDGETREDDRADPCPKCGGRSLHYGYGLAGGGIGPYAFCADEQCDFFDKTQDEELSP